MARPQRPWFRFYVEATRDPKMRRLAPHHRWLWVSVLSAARESPIPGYLMVSEDIPYHAADLADYAGMKVKEVERGTDAMTELGMLECEHETWFVPRWSERQFESDVVALRTRKHRSQEQ